MLILGWGELIEATLDEIAGGGEFVVVTADTERVASLNERDVAVLAGNPSDMTLLLSAGIEHARTMLVALDDDGDDAIAVLTASGLNPDVRIVAPATKRETVRKLE